jgi:3'(2'), 5'-bisphosphate nucleotidase/myo-inositol-1(or 4)-monophosphatase
MQLTLDDLLYLSDRAIVAAKEAGRIIASYSGKSVSVQHKEGGVNLASKVVTEVDLRSEKAIIEILRLTCEQYDLALLTEESADDRARLEKDYFWCVDPLDGTLSFIESNPGYSVSIALVSQSGTPVIGVVYDPVTHTLYSAVKGQGVMRNGEPWSVASISEQKSMTGKPLTLVYERGLFDQPNYPRLHEALKSIASQHGFAGLQTLEKQGAVLNACWVLENPPAVFFKFPKAEEGGGSLWDFAATVAIFHELGAIASDVFGQPLELNRSDSTFMNHRGVLFASDQSLASETQGLLEQCISK